MRSSMLRIIQTGKTSIRSLQSSCSLRTSRKKAIFVPDLGLIDPKLPIIEQGRDVERTYAHHIIKLIPDADIDFVLELVTEFHPIHGERVVDYIVNVLLPPQKEPEIIVSQDIECGCCFAEYPLDQIVQCPEAHLFCVTCMTTQTSSLLSTSNPCIKCIDQSGCTAEIPPCELRRFLPENVFMLWERVNQRHQLESAGLAQLVDCPFCDWACIIEDEDGQFLFCRNHDVCGVVSCRWCKKHDHYPNPCKDDEEAQHTIEEAMSSALVRNCPKCNKAFIKDSGCNKMTCPKCHTLSCYICRQVITNGYSHFSSSHGTIRPGICPLWDSVEQNHDRDVKEAGERATREYAQARRKNPVKTLY